MTQHHTKQADRNRIRLKFFGIGAWIESFLRDCKRHELSPYTIEFYRAGLVSFMAFCVAQDVNEVEAITTDSLRRYLLELEAT